eukprot:853628-Pleurochrysis_carterae.AAC.1
MVLNHLPLDAAGRRVDIDTVASARPPAPAHPCAFISPLHLLFRGVQAHALTHLRPCACGRRLARQGPPCGHACSAHSCAHALRCVGVCVGVRACASRSRLWLQRDELRRHRLWPRL